MRLSEPQKKYLRGLGHSLKPVVMIGDAGLTESVTREYLSALERHELVKVRIRVGDRDLRDDIISALCKAGEAALVTRIGNVAVIYRANPDKPRISLPTR